MNMKIDISLIKAERLRRAWSQEQLALVAGLGLRTVNRIEKSGQCSLESLKSLASVFELLPEDLVLQTQVPRKATSAPENTTLKSILKSIRKFVTGGIVGAFLASLSFIAADTVFAAQVQLDKGGSVAASQTESSILASYAYVDIQETSIRVTLPSGEQLVYSITPENR